MADDLTLQTTLATPPSGSIIATRKVSYGGNTAAVAPVGLVVFQGANGAKLVFDLGAASNFHLVATGSSGDANSILAAPGLLLGLTVFSVRGTPLYVKFHNTAGTPTAGSGVVQTIGVQAGVAPPTVTFPQGGVFFSTGIGLTIVTGLADASSSSVAAGDCVVDVQYVGAAS